MAGESKVREGKQIGRVGTREGGRLGGRVEERGYKLVALAERQRRWWL